MLSIPPLGTTRPHWLRTLASDAADLLFPRVCLNCRGLMPRAERAFTCATCWSRVVPLPHPRCARCGHPHRRSGCRWCAFVSPVVDVARSWCWADDAVGSTIVHAIKYHGWCNVAGEIAARLARLDLGDVAAPRERVLVPVPLAARRRRERGYNQSERLARELAVRWGAGAPVELVHRVRETPTQTRLTPEQRLHNVANAFRVDAARVSALGNAAFVLVDDVITTGATLNACAEALASAGARTIGYITFGRARDPRDAPPSRGTTSHGDSGRH